jgi:cobalamin biosynthesis protein CobD/CbiB
MGLAAAAVGADRILCFILFWPAMWANPIEALTKIIAAAQNYAEDAYGTSRVFFNGVIVDNGELGSEFYYFYPLNYLWRTTPVVLLGLAAALIAVILPRKELHSEGGESSEPPSQGRLSSTLSPPALETGAGSKAKFRGKKPVLPCSPCCSMPCCSPSQSV